MMKIVFYKIIGSFILFTLISCDSDKLPKMKEFKQIKINQRLEDILRKDLDCFRKTYPKINNDSISFVIFASVLDRIDTNITVLVSCNLKIDTNCLGVFYIDSFAYTVYGEFSNKLYSYNKDKLFLNENIFRPDKGNDKLDCIEYYWHYQLKDDNLTYFIQNNMCN